MAYWVRDTYLSVVVVGSVQRVKQDSHSAVQKDSILHVEDKYWPEFVFLELRRRLCGCSFLSSSILRDLGWVNIAGDRLNQ